MIKIAVIILLFSVYIMKRVVKIQDKDLLQTNILFSSLIASTSIQLPENAEVNYHRVKIIHTQKTPKENEYKIIRSGDSCCKKIYITLPEDFSE